MGRRTATEKPKKKEDLVQTLWDAKTFQMRLKEHQDNRHMMYQVLSEVHASNMDHIQFRSMRTPVTDMVTYKECMKALLERQVQGYRSPPTVSISKRTTAQA